MAVNLTSNAIEMICNGEIQGDDVKPVLQVADLKLLSAGQQNSTERYRMLLSDGSYMQQGMLATQMNSLVHGGKLNKGSIVQLSQFVSQVIQNRKIIIIVELNVIIEKCDPVGDPKMFGQGGSGPASTPTPQVRTSIAGQSSVVHPGNPHSYGALAATPPLAQNVGGRGAFHNPEPRGLNSTNGPSIYPKAETGTRNPASNSLSGGYSDQNRNAMNIKLDGGRAPMGTYGRSLQPTYQQTPSMYTNRGPIAKNEAPARIIPIAALNPYQGRWTIKARVTAKKDLRHYNNARGEGKVFSFDLLDSDGGEIKVTCFNAVADQFYGMIEAGRVYLISNGMLKPAQKTFNHLNNEYEIMLENNSTVQLCTEEDDSIPRQQFNFRPIADIENMDSGAIVDVIGVVSSITLTATIMKKDGTATLKRSLQLKDMSGRSVEVTLWGNFCNAEGQKLQDMCDSGVFPVMAVKAGRINDFNGKSVGTVSSSQLFIEPEFSEAHNLRDWFDNEGRNKSFVSISRETMGMGKTDVRKTISQIKDERLGTSEKPDWITVNATISFIKADNFCYTACPLMVGERQCSKKVTNNGDGQWRCDRCDQSVPQCDYRYLLSFQIQDHTGVTWVTAFQECGEEIMGVSAKEMYYLKFEEQDDEKFANIIRGVLFTQYLFKLKVKEETFSDEQRIKSTVVKAEKLDVTAEARFLLDMMDKLVEDPNAILGKVSSGVMETGTNSYGLGSKQVPNMGVNSSAGRDTWTPTNNVGQYGNPYNSTREAATVGTGVYVLCSSCGGTGHNAQNCPSLSNRQVQPMAGGYNNYGSAASNTGECYKCRQSGHWARDCPGSNATSAGSNAFSAGSAGECYKCHQPGHWARDCPGSNGSSMYEGGGGAGAGRYGGGVSRQRAGF